MRAAGDQNANRPSPPRKQLRLNLPVGSPATGSSEVVSIPSADDLGLRLSWEQARLLSEDLESLVLTDRVSSPRELIHRLETTVQAILEVDSVRFLPMGAPSGEFWRDVESASVGIPRQNLEELAQAGAEALYVRDLAQGATKPASRARTGCGLYLGVRDEQRGWWAILEVRNACSDSLSPEKIALAAFLARHLRVLVGAAVRLQSMIFLDYLTGLYNRPYFEDQLEKQIVIAHRRHSSVALSIIDIDDFKSFNTAYGYRGGDEALRTVGTRLRSAIRATDTLARYGGEEFAIVHGTPVSAEEVRFIADRLLRSVDVSPVSITSMEGETVEVRITVSIGVALLEHPSLSADRLRTAANRMLLDAKQAGKDCVRFTESAE